MKDHPCHDNRLRYRPKTTDGVEVLPSKEDQEEMLEEARIRMDSMIAKMYGVPMPLGGVASEYIETEVRTVTGSTACLEAMVSKDGEDNHG